MEVSRASLKRSRRAGRSEAWRVKRKVCTIVQYGRSGSKDDNASGVGYDPPDGSRDLDLGFLVPLPSGLTPGEFRLVGSIGNWFTSPLRGSQGRRGGFLLRGS